jgi:hypothetical protein
MDFINDTATYFNFWGAQMYEISPTVKAKTPATYTQKHNNKTAQALIFNTIEQ